MRSHNGGNVEASNAIINGGQIQKWGAHLGSMALSDVSALKYWVTENWLV